jgi:hypothetical protein
MIGDYMKEDETITDNEREAIKILVSKYPVLTLQCLNRQLNEEGFGLAISKLAED